MDSHPGTPAADIDPNDTGHDYDGIRELDNRLPNWWLGTFFATIVFGFGYWFYYDKLEGPSLADDYRAEVAAALAKTEAPPNDESLLALAHDGGQMLAAKALFQAQCSACHGMNAEGKIGPNLTDAAWIHGGKPSEIWKTIDGGVLAKGMPAWGPVLGGARARSLAAFVVAQKGKNLPGKAHEGQPEP